MKVGFIALALKRSLLAGQSGALALAWIASSTALAQKAIQLTPGSFTRDIVYENDMDGPSVTGIQQLPGGTAYVASGRAWTENGLFVGGTSTIGLPTSLVATSINTNTVTGGFSQFALQSYSGNNVLWFQNLPAGTVAQLSPASDTTPVTTGTLTFSGSSITAYNTLNFLTSSTSDSTTAFTVTLNYSDGTPSVTLTQTLNSRGLDHGGDLTVFGGLSLASNPNATGFPTTNPTVQTSANNHIDEIAFDLGAAGVDHHPIASVTLSYASSTPHDDGTAIWGVSGVKASTVFKWSGGGPLPYDSQTFTTPRPTSNSANWVGGISPDKANPANGGTSDASSILLFETRGYPAPTGYDPYGYNVDFDTNVTVSSIRFRDTSDSYNLTSSSGRSITLGGVSVLDGLSYAGSIFLPSGRAQTINVPLILGADTLVNNANNGQGSINLYGPINLQGNKLTVGGTGIVGGNASGTGNVVISGVISGAGTLDKTGLGKLTLSGSSPNTFTGATLVAKGTLEATTAGALGSTTSVKVNTGGTLLLSGSSADRINNSAAVELAGGTFNTGGLSETVGSLTQSGNSIIDLGNGSSILHFADSSATLWSGTLTFLNWSGDGTGNGTDQVYFGSDANGLTPDQLSRISFIISGSPVTAQMLSPGQVIPSSFAPVPEPGTVVGVAMLVGLVGFRERRRVVRWFGGGGVGLASEV